jgi:hypothetical protein
MKVATTMLAFGLLTVVCGGRALAQVPPRPQATPEHKGLSSEVGTWDAVVKSFMGQPGAEPMVSKGVEVNIMMSGGLWLLSKFEGDFGGQPFEGRGQFGYDPLQKKYVGTWIDSYTPSLSVLEGNYDPATKTMTYVGDGVDPRTKSKFTQKMVTITKDERTRVFTLYVTAPETGNKEVKVMEITYRKRS